MGIKSKNNLNFHHKNWSSKVCTTHLWHSKLFVTTVGGNTTPFTLILLNLFQVDLLLQTSKRLTNRFSWRLETAWTLSLLLLESLWCYGLLFLPCICCCYFRVKASGRNCGACTDHPPTNSESNWTYPRVIHLSATLSRSVRGTSMKDFLCRATHYYSSLILNKIRLRGVTLPFHFRNTLLSLWILNARCYKLK